LHDDFKMGFPLPFFIVFCGYALILTIDKVVFDSNPFHDHSHGHGHDTVEKNLLKAASKAIRPRTNSGLSSSK